MVNMIKFIQIKDLTDLVLKTYKALDMQSISIPFARNNKRFIVEP